MFIVNVEAAIMKNEKWLVIQRGLKEEHAAGTLSLVGGKVDSGGIVQDVLEETIKREVEEEVGVTITNNIQYVHSTSFIADDNIRVVDIVFLCEIKKGEPYRKSPDEVENIYWLTTEEIMNHPDSPPWLKESIKRAEQITR
ncbi:ADP-ribose pyrophosphatase YjhB (NUDIX family) [Bacillus oleivorans]|uniref:ADP-ribose pyrophosphatase YjhB (NUDIX family) n=1 Tax=Bacillus oleivorans TaxID=1448271 RepID=A0A285CHZ6_9BACI|nr:NUDIX domain-containing protein [Bacillus oleivorans]SNX66965.1 ADP-ribose pyrophosphatase YjhB (NUDIX family) [Bacillus oleivorans]